MLQSPFSKLSRSSERNLTISLLILLVATIIVMLFFDSFLKNEVAENGIVSFELAKDLETSTSILDSWKEQAKIAASLSMGLDFLFLIIYALFIGLLIHKINERLWKNKPFNKVGIILVWAAFIMALSDVIENIALIKLLLGDMQQHWSSIAYYFAILKFTILIIGMLYILLNFIYLFIKKISSVQN